MDLCTCNVHIAYGKWVNYISYASIYTSISYIPVLYGVLNILHTHAMAISYEAIWNIWRDTVPKFIENNYDLVLIDF